MSKNFNKQRVYTHFMKGLIAYFFLFFSLFSFANTSSSQGQSALQRRITISVENMKIKDILKKIETTDSVHFAYLINPFNVEKQVSLSIENAPLEQVLDRLFESKAIFEDRGDVILIKLANAGTDLIIGVTGKITDDKGDPLPGVNVVVKGTIQGTTTDTDGKYNLTVDDPNAILVFSFVGYVSQEITVGSQSAINITLSVDNKQLEEVVVVGYGTQKKQSLTGAVATVNLDKLTSRSLYRPEEALQGMAPGVLVQNNGGGPTSTPRVNVRGLGGINGESALWVVDGVIVDQSLVQLNPNDIEAISVLKDASAAIYGARASGGVILVTTKKARGEKLTITGDFKGGVQQPWRILQALDAADFATVRNLAATNAGKGLSDAFNASVYPDGQITRTNWMNEIFRTGKIQDYSVSLQGKSKKSSFYSSVGYRRNDGILLNTYNERANLRLNSEHQVADYLKIGENIALSLTNGQDANTTSGQEGVMVMALMYPPHVPVYDSAGNFSGLPKKYAGTYSDVFNPVANLKRLDINNPVTTLFFNPYVEIKIWKGLKFKSNLGLTRSSGTYKRFIPRVPEIGKINDGNRLEMSNSVSRDILAEQSLVYNQVFGKHSVDAMAAYVVQNYSYESFEVGAKNYALENPQYRYFDNTVGGENNTNLELPKGSKLETKLISWVSRINYSFADRYLITGIVRRDGSSLLPSVNRWRIYPSASVGWRISKESFFKSNFINELKLRASWGRLGNLGSLPAYAYNPPMVRAESYIGGNRVSGYAPEFAPNPDLKWAYSEQKNMGLDVSLLEARISFTADYFIKETNQMLYKRALSSTSGNKYRWENLPGRATDRGIELGLSFTDDGKKELGYTINGTFSHIVNKVNSLDSKLDLQKIPFGTKVRDQLDPSRIAAGQSLYSFYTVQTAGIFKTQEEIDNYVDKKGNKIQPDAKPGDLKFIDADGDGKITDSDNKDRVYSGSAYPKFIFGLSSNFSYKNFDLNIFFQGVSGNKIFNGFKYLGLYAGHPGNANSLEEIKNAWSPENPNSDIPRINAKDPNNNFGTTSDWYLEDGSYLRLKNLTLGYRLPGNILEKTKLSSLRIYVTCANVFTITKYKGFDPEVGLDVSGVDVGRYPQARTIMAGLQIGL